MDETGSEPRQTDNPGSVRRRRTFQHGEAGRRRRHLARWLISGTAVIAILAASALWLGLRAGQLRDHLAETQRLLPQLKTQLLANDVKDAKSTLSSLESATAAARESGTDPVWMLASALPWIGPNLSAATEAATSADDVIRLAAGPLVDVFETLNWKALTPQNGTVSLAPLESAAPKIASAANTVQLSFDRLDRIDTSALLPQVSGPFVAAKDQLNQVRSALSTASGAAQVIPSMMGTQGPRNYLLLVQNSAEIRATGGIPGALAVIKADKGKVELAGQGSASALGEFVPPVYVDPQQETIYSNRLGSFMQDVNLTPDFPTAASAAKAMWEQKNPGQTIDGVVGIDPVALATFLEVTGPVDVSADLPSPRFGGGLPGTLTSSNLVKTLLSDVYADIKDPKTQDAYFASVAKSVFDQVANGKGSAEKLVGALGEGVAQNRIYVWSSHAAEQKVLGDFPLSGRIAGPSVPAAGFGAYFNDGTGAKMDYYVKRTVQLQQRCSAGGYNQYTVSVTLTNTAPSDAASTLPAYVTGGGAYGVTPGNIVTNVIVYGPSQARVESARLDGASVPLGSFVHESRPVGVVRVQLAPGQTQTIDVDVAKVIQNSSPVLDVTPTIQNVHDVILPERAATTCAR